MRGLYCVARIRSMSKFYVAVKWILISAMLSAMVGCVRTATIQPAEVVVDTSAGQFVPVRTFLNRKEVVMRSDIGRFDAVNASLKKSGAFFDVGSHVSSPVVFDMQLRRVHDDGVKEFAHAMLSAATLFLIPVKVTATNTLKVDVYAYGNLLKTYDYTEEYSQILGLHNYVEVVENRGNEFLSIENIINRFVNQIEVDQILPKVRVGDDGQMIVPDVEGSDQQAHNQAHHAGQLLWSPSI